MKRRGDSDACRPVLNVVGHRGTDTEIVERGWTKLPHELIDVAIQPLGDRFDRVDQRPPEIALSTRVLEHANAERERGELLTELVVHFTGNSPPLILLRKDEASEKLGPCAFRLRAFPRCEIEI